MRRVIEVEASQHTYSVVVDPDGFDGFEDFLMQALKGEVTRAALVTDSHVGPLWADALASACPSLELMRMTLPAGEAHKTLATWEGLVSDLLAAEVHRHMPVIALGGGVVGDMAGFAAACTMRGLPFITVPTTLLAMVDASVGGKTAVNHPRGKNLVGAFHAPRLVWAALPTLATLPEAERRSGWGEVIKTGLVGDAALLERLEQDTVDVAGTVAGCVAVKAQIVAQDERESGVRAVLNAGHTVGHAIETALGHGVMTHGEAVAVGLVAEARYAVRAGVCADPALPDRIDGLARRRGLVTSLPEVAHDALLAAVRLDKKGAQDTITVPLPVQPGLYTLTSIPWSGVAALWTS